MAEEDTWTGDYLNRKPKYQNNSAPDFVTRHSIKPTKEDSESLRYPGISTKGVEVATKERAQEILDLLDKSPAGTVMFISGVSIPKNFPQNLALQRTRSTATAYGDGIETLLKQIGRADIRVITPSVIKEVSKGHGPSWTINAIADYIASHPNTKFVVDYPLFFKEISVEPWLNQEGTNWSEYNLEITKDRSDYDAMKEWVRTKGVMLKDGKELKGPTPQDTAKGFEQAIERLKQFARDKVEGRPISIGLVSHGWLTDAFVIYAATGKIDEESMEKVMKGKPIDQSELAAIETHDGNLSVLFRGELFRQDRTT